MNQVESGTDVVTGTIRKSALIGQSCPLSALESRFIENWAGLAKAFGMDGTLGRVHALTFVREEGLHAVTVSEVLGLEELEAARYLEELVRWGVVRKAASSHGVPTFSADGDPWSWFMTTLKERGRREFGPLIDSIRDANVGAQRLRSSLPPGSSAAELRRIERIARFTQFVEQIAGMIETFASVGAGPMMSALRMVAKMRGPRLVRA